MKKTFALLALLVACSLGSAANAASVLINVVFGFQDSSYEIWAQASADNGNIALTTTGFTSMTLEPLPQISPLDSPFREENGALQITSFQHQDLIPIGQDFILLATLTGPGPLFSVSADHEGVGLFGYGVLNQELDELIGWELYMNGTLVDSWEPDEVPEPTAIALLGLGVAGLALSRRAT